MSAGTAAVPVGAVPSRVETIVTLPADEGGTDSFAAVDLLGAAERRLGWRTGACPVTLPPGGALLLRLDR